MKALKEYQAWLKDENIDAATKQELRAIEGDQGEIYDRFSKQLEFGTGGLRGIIGAGTNRINIYTVRLATQAFADYLLSNNLVNKGIVIGCDPRYMSPEFVEETAAVLIGNGIPVYRFAQVVPTPLLSFAVRHCEADGGIMITASHNSKEYNGYKAYNREGVQLLPEEAKAISSIMDRLCFADIKHNPKTESSPLCQWVQDELIDDYFSHLADLLPKSPRQDRTIKIMYTALHGSGAGFVPRALAEAGFSQVNCVHEQCVHDGGFPTVAYPNPEEPEAFTLAFNYAAEGDYDLILATDPDGDRVGVAVFTDERFVLLTGNQVGVLIADYLLQLVPADRSSNQVIVKTIVSTDMVTTIAKKYGAQVWETLTGFKYIGAKITEIEADHKEFLFGFEESCGYLAGTFVRDKDAVIACLLVAQMAAYYKSQGISLVQRLVELMEDHGYYLEGLQSYYFANLGEEEKAAAFIQKLRREFQDHLGPLEIKYFKDYLTGVVVDLDSKETSKFNFPRENVLQWETPAGDRITLRPSGTEPKMKLYISIVAANMEEAEVKLVKLQKACDQIINDGLKQVMV